MKYRVGLLVCGINDQKKKIRWTLLIIRFFGTKTKINILAKNLDGGTFIKMIQKW